MSVHSLVQSLASISIALIFLSSCATMKNTQDLQSAESPSSQQYQALLTAGDDALALNDLDTAQVKYALAVSQQPENIIGLYKLASVHYLKQSYGVAENILERVVAAEASHAGALELLGFIALRSEKLTLAQSRFEQALRQRPSRWRSLNGLGVVNDLQLKHPEAQSYFRKALDLLPGDSIARAKVLNNLGYSIYLQGQYALSVDQFLKATRLAPDYAKAWSNLGLGLARLGRYDQARAAFARLSDPHIAANNLGYVGMLLGDLEMAKREIATALQTAPSYYPLANENLALLNQRTEKGVQSVMEGQGLPNPAAIVVVPAVSRPQGEAARPSPTTRVQAQRLPGTPIKQREKMASYLLFLGYSDNVKKSVDAGQLSEAISHFQINFGLPVTGQTDDKTVTSLTTAVVARAQLFLASLGYQPGENPGVLDEQTRAALRRFEQDQSLPVDGTLDTIVLKRLASSL